MMKKFATSLFVIAIGFMTATASVSKDPVTATINNQMQIVLPADQPLADEYVIDITAINFANAQVLEQFCNTFADQNLTLRGDFEAKKLFVSAVAMKDSAGQIWDAQKWNTYFEMRAIKMAAYMQSMNK
jgi:hypothetical protein